MTTTLQTLLLSSLEKVFPNAAPQVSFYNHPMFFRNESFNFQIAYYTEDTSWLHQHVHIEIESPLKDQIVIKSVGLVPSEFPSYANPDKDYLTTMPGLLPDALMPLPTASIKVVPTQWRSLWFEVMPGTTVPSGDQPIRVLFKNGQGQVVSEVNFTLTLLDAVLPKQKLIHTEWFHTDSLAHFYNVPVFSDLYWVLVKSYMHTASKHGINMILTPLFTPPLDTEVGKERLTVQLIDIFLEGETYRFNFDKLEKWINMAIEVGIEYFEMSHLFTQWGAHSTPKIMVHTKDELIARFGWHVAATDPSYKQFLEQFLPQLKTFLDTKGLQGKCYFHLSDEPSLAQIDAYKEAHDLVQSHLGDYPLMDALSNLEFYEKGIIEYPVCSNDHVHTFIDAKVPHLWTYYCCAQHTDVSNRFMALPSFRNRILGVQLFSYNIEGFLHWGYNFWNTHLSKSAINPFMVTDAGMTFPSGDPFLVYPGTDGPIESIRLKVLAEAIYDLRALELLESLTSRETVLGLINENLESPLTFKDYPRNAQYLLELRQKVNQLLLETL